MNTSIDRERLAHFSSQVGFSCVLIDDLAKNGACELHTLATLAFAKVACQAAPKMRHSRRSFRLLLSSPNPLPKNSRNSSVLLGKMAVARTILSRRMASEDSS